jgi:hypothetical protein
MLKQLVLALAVGVMTPLPAVSPAWAQSQQQDQETIYGSQLMSEQERLLHRDRMRTAKTDEERKRIRAEHHAQMQERAKERGVTLPEEPPARGQGMGMGPGGGQGRVR